MKPTQNAIPIDSAAPRRKPLGSYLRDVSDLGEEQIARIAAYQRERGLRFGEAAVALSLAGEQDVIDALSAQFGYPAGSAEVDAELVVAADAFGEQAELFRELRSRLLLEVLPETAPFALAVLSPDRADGKTYLAANLATAFAQLGSRTLLIDADLRAPRLDKLLRVQRRAGLSEVLAGFAPAEEALHRAPNLGNLWLMPAGALPPNPLELLQRPAFEALLAAMKEKFDRIVVDTAAASFGADCRAVAARCTASVVLARKDETRMASLEKLVTALERSDGVIAGMVMNER